MLTILYAGPSVYWIIALGAVFFVFFPILSILFFIKWRSKKLFPKVP